MSGRGWKMKRKPPVRHDVSGYTRKDGTKVDDYRRGRGTKPTRKSKIVGSMKREGYRVIPLGGRGQMGNLEKAGYSWVIEEGIIQSPLEIRDMWADYGYEKYTPTGKTKTITFMLIVHNRIYPTEIRARQGYRYEPGDDEWYIDNIPG